MKTFVYDSNNPPGLRRDQKVLEAKLRYYPLLNVNKDMAGKYQEHRQVRTEITLLRVELETGRKHQIRAQLRYTSLEL